VLLRPCKGHLISYRDDDDDDDADKIIIVFDPGKCWKTCHVTVRAGLHASLYVIFVSIL